MSTSAYSRYFDTHEAARVMRLAPATLRKWRQSGQGPSFSKVHGKVIYAETDIHDYIIDRRVNSTSEYRH